MIAPEGDARDCCAEIVACPPVAALAVLWRDLETCADVSVFLSWAWIGTMIEHFGSPEFLARITSDGRLVGLALLGYRPGSLVSLRRPSLHLNETGDPVCGQLATEYNGILAMYGYEAAALAALLAAVSSRHAPVWREFRLNGVSPAWLEACRARGLIPRLLRHPQDAPYMDFTVMAAEDPLAAMSGNTRQQVSRSIRFYRERGELILTRARDAVEAQDFLDRLEALHIASWQLRGKPGAFAEARFRGFHRRLIERTYRDGVPDLLRLSVGSEAIGYLYNFVWRGLVYSYQSGLQYEEDTRSRPGLVAHVMAMRRYREEGLSGYRMLAGASRYKTSLANGRDRLLWLALHPADLPHRLEAWAQSLRHGDPASSEQGAPE